MRIAKLNNQNYQTWKFKVELLLTKEDLWDTISSDPPDPLTDAWRSKDCKARATIGLLLEDNQLHHVRKESTAKSTWTALQRYHEKSTLSNKVSLLKKLCGLKLTDCGNMESHLAQMEDLIDQLSSLGETLAEHLTVALFLSSLPDSYGTLITALETRDEADLTTVKNKLIEEFKRRTEIGVVTNIQEQQALETTADKDTRRTATNTSAQITCFFCKKPNHMKKDCRKYIEWKKKHPDHKAKTVCQDDAAGDNNCNSEQYSMSPAMCFKAHTTDIEQSWYIDSGATSHMCGDRNFFVKLDELKKSHVILADGQKLTSAGVGEGVLQNIIEDGRNQQIKLLDVLYVPELKGNLISVKKLTDKGFEVHFKDDQCHIMKDGKILIRANEDKGLYYLQLIQTALKTVEVNEAKCIHFWHNRFGHRDPNAIRILEKNKIAEGIDIKPCDVFGVCECCIKAKMSRKSVPKKSESRASEILELIHTDVCGPMQTTTPSGNRYFMTMIDDHSKFTKVYLLKNKSEVPNKIKEYVKYVQTKFRITPKKIRSDRGGEYTGEELKNFFKAEGIQMELTTPYTPQQNGCAERKNRYLVEMARSMLIDSDLPKKYWGEAVVTANHMQNRLPVTGNEVTPYESWNKRKPNLQYVKQFGCIAYAAIPPERRQKLDNKAKQLVFVGYEEGTKGYRLLDTSTDKIVISKDVIFIEGDPHVNTKTVPQVPHSVMKDDTYTELLLKEDHVETQNDHVETQNYPVRIDTEPPRNEPVELRVSKRSNKGKPPERLIETINKVTVESTEPKTFKEALSSIEAKQWIEAMDDEIDCLNKNETWTLTELPEGKTAIGCKWVYKAKTDEHGVVTRYKARLVAQGYSQKYGEDYDEVFAPVAKSTTLRALLTIAGREKMIVNHYDIQSAYLNADVSHEVYMKQPDGYVHGKNNLVCKLNKNLYGLKQGANEWNKKLHDILSKNSYKRSENDMCLYSKQDGENRMYISVHVDDIIVAATDMSMITKFEKQMNEVVALKNLGKLHYYLGLQFERTDDGTFLLHQQSYIEKKLKEFNLSDSRPSNIPVDTGYQKSRPESQECLTNDDVYRRAIGSLLYLSTNSRPDIAVGTSILARHVSNPKQADWIEVKRIFRYLNKTKEKKLRLGSSDDQSTHQLIGYADADWGGDAEERKSNTGYVFIFLGATISWASRKQSMVTLSSTEAEYIALAEAAQEAMYLCRILKDLNQPVEACVIYEDNQSCIKILPNDQLTTRRTKHIDTKFHFVRELFKNGAIEIRYCPTDKMIADLLTKPLGAIKTEHFVRGIGLAWLYSGHSGHVVVTRYATIKSLRGCVGLYNDLFKAFLVRPE